MHPLVTTCPRFIVLSVEVIELPLKVFFVEFALEHLIVKLALFQNLTSRLGLLVKLRNLGGTAKQVSITSIRIVCQGASFK